MSEKRPTKATQPAPRGRGEAEEVVLSESTPSHLGRTAILLQFWYSVLALAVATLLAILGVVLVIHGVGGKASWTAQLLQLKVQISDAVPGVSLMLIAVLLATVARYSVRIKPTKRAESDRKIGG